LDGSSQRASSSLGVSLGHRRRRVSREREHVPVADSSPPAWQDIYDDPPVRLARRLHVRRARRVRRQCRWRRFLPARSPPAHGQVQYVGVGKGKCDPRRRASALRQPPARVLSVQH